MTDEPAKEKAAREKVNRVFYWKQHFNQTMLGQAQEGYGTPKAEED